MLTPWHVSRQNEQNPHTPGSATSVQATPVAEISGITGYRLVGLLLAIAGLVKTALSVKGISAPVNKMDLVITGVFGILYGRIMDSCTEFTTYWRPILTSRYLCLGWAESSTRQFWRPFFRRDLSPTIILGVRVGCRGTVKCKHSPEC